MKLRFVSLLHPDSPLPSRPEQMSLDLTGHPVETCADEPDAGSAEIIPFAEALAYYAEVSRAEALRRILARSPE